MKIETLEKTEFDQKDSSLAAIRSLETIPAILVSGSKILDGHHRYTVALERGETEIEAVEITADEIAALENEGYEITAIYAAAYFVAHEYDQAEAFAGEFGDAINRDCIASLEILRGI